MKKIFTLILLFLVITTGAKAEKITLTDNEASSIETAITNAADGDTIMLKAGEYEISNTLNVPDKDLTIIGAGIMKTALSGVDLSNVLLFNCNSGDKNLTIENLVMTGAESGAIRVAGNRTVTLKNCDISFNSATDGGAINIASTSASATLINCAVGTNSATNGGAIFTNGDLTLVNTLITKNDAITKGGGIYIGNTTAKVRIINSIIAGNTVNAISANDIQDSGTAGYTLEMLYSAYGEGPTPTNETTTNLTGVNPATILVYDLPAGEAQTEGTQTLLYGSDFWYLDKADNKWKSLTATDEKTLSQLGGANADILSDNMMGFTFFIDRYVTTHEDVVDATDGKTSLREAITFMAAGIGQFGLPITFSPATDGKAIVLKNESGYKTFAIGIEQVVTIHGNGADKTIIDGGEAVQIFNISQGGAGKAGGSLTMEGVTLQNGKGSIGGAIDNKGTLLLKNSVLKDNTATDGGGAIYNGASLTLINCALTDNTGGADGGNGGAIYIGSSSAATLLMNTTVTGNSTSFNGGGLYVESGSTTTILNSIIVGNTASSSGKDIYNAGDDMSIRLVYSAYGDWGGTETSNKAEYLSDLSASAVFADPGVSLALLKDSDVATKGTLVALKNDDYTVGAFWDYSYPDYKVWINFTAGGGVEFANESEYTTITTALDTDPASGYPQRNNNEEIYSMGAVLAVAEAETDPGVHHELIFIVDEGIRINPNVPAYDIAEGHDYTFYMYMNAGFDQKKPYVTVNGQPVVINPTQDGTGWVYRIPAVYEDKMIEIVLQDLTDNLNPEEAGVNIYSSAGALIVDVAQSTSVTIYNIAGQAVAQQTVEGRATFNLPKGVYIVKTDKGTTKAVVR